ncbi:MAG: hypothetical protein WA445_15935 [Pseudolabrys sp.]
MAKQYVRFDEIEDVLSSVDLLALCVPFLDREPSYWKWAIISAHASLQGAMVCALRDTSGVSILDRQSGREMIRWHNGEIEKHPEEKLADFNLLLKRCCKGRHMQGQALKLSSSQLRDIERLHKEFRNNFAHFIPQGWSIEKAGLPRIVCASVDATEILMAHRNVELSGNRKRRLASGLATARTRLK